MKLRLIIVSVILLNLMSSCALQKTGIKETTLSENPTVSSLPNPSATVSSTPVPSSTFTSTPTDSPEQQTETFVDASVRKVMQTHEAFMFTAAPATLEARKAKCKNDFVLEVPFETITTYSTEQWTLFTCSPKPENYADMWTPGVVDFGTRYTQVTKVDQSRTWIIQHNSFDYSIIDRPDAFLKPYRWTADGKYLYLYPVYYPGGSGFSSSAYFYTFDVLYRLDLETGNFKQILSKVNSYSLSPDNQWFIFSPSDHPGTIQIMDVKIGSSHSILLDNAISETGRYTWTPDSTEVVFASGYNTDNTNENSSYDVSATSLYKLSIKNMYLKTILHKDTRALIPDFCGKNDNCWIDANTIQVASLKPGNEFLNNISLNIQTGEVANYIIPTVTPNMTFTPNPSSK